LALPRLDILNDVSDRLAGLWIALQGGHDQGSQLDPLRADRDVDGRAIADQVNQFRLELDLFENPVCGLQRQRAVAGVLCLLQHVDGGAVDRLELLHHVDGGSHIGLSVALSDVRQPLAKVITLVAIERRSRCSETFRYVPERLTTKQRGIDRRALRMGADRTHAGHCLLLPRHLPQYPVHVRCVVRSGLRDEHVWMIALQSVNDLVDGGAVSQVRFSGLV